MSNNAPQTIGPQTAAPALEAALAEIVRLRAINSGLVDSHSWVNRHPLALSRVVFIFDLRSEDQPWRLGCQRHGWLGAVLDRELPVAVARVLLALDRAHAR